jgi:hypothetical protein
MHKIRKYAQDNPLEGSWGITKTKWKNLVGKGAPWTSESGLVMISWVNLDLIIPTETI